MPVRLAKDPNVFNTPPKSPNYFGLPELGLSQPLNFSLPQSTTWGNKEEATFPNNENIKLFYQILSKLNQIKISIILIF